MATRSVTALGRGPRRREFEIDRRAQWIDTLIVGGIFAAILFNLVIGPLTVLVVFGAVAAFCLLRWERLAGIAVDCWPLLLLPFFVLLSTLWSEVPFTTLRYGFLYAVTAFAGIIVGGGLRRSSYVNGYFAAFALYSVASILFGRWVFWGDGPGDAFAGLAGSKNTSGDMAGVAIIATIVFVCSMLDRKLYAPAIAAMALFPVLGFLLWWSHATGALIATVLASACLIAWIVSRRLERQARGGIFVAIMIVGGIALLTQQWWLGPMFDLVLEASGKDAGLTGRADLWIFGNRLISENPWLGLGYNAFWLQDSLDAQYLWNMMGIASRQGFNFHNTAMEIVVHLGYVGLLIAVVTAAIGIAMLVRNSLEAPRLSTILACALLVFFGVKVPFEVVGFGTMHFTTVTAYAVFAMGLRRDRPEGPKRKAATTRPPSGLRRVR